MTRFDQSSSPFKRNFLATCIAGAALGVSQLVVDPFHIGSELALEKRAHAGPPVVTSSNSFPLLAGQPVKVASRDLSSEGILDTSLINVSPEQGLQPILAEDSEHLRGVWAVKMAHSLLERGCRAFAEVPDYTASMMKQERVHGELSERQEIDIKVRHEPFSIYMKWHSGDRGRQLIYVEGENNGNLLVQPGGIKGRLTGVMALEPNCSMAMAESRYPISSIGLLELGKKIMNFQKLDIERGNGFTCELRDHEHYDDRPCYLYQIEYHSPEFHSVYRKCQIFLDKEHSLPICVVNYTWPETQDVKNLDEETLVEFYAYSDLKFQNSLTAGDFDQHNASYRLRVR